MQEALQLSKNGKIMTPIRIYDQRVLNTLFNS